MKSAAFAAALITLAIPASAQTPETWTIFTHKGAPATLLFGSPVVDAAALTFRCAPKSGQIEVAARFPVRLGARQNTAGDWLDRAGVRGPWPASIGLSSGLASATLRGRALVDDEPERSVAITDFSSRAPVVAAFRKSGLIEVSALGETLRPPPAPKGLVRKFLGVCR